MSPPGETRPRGAPPVPRSEVGGRSIQVCAGALMVCLVAAILALVPQDADPGWWDASRHAMDGAFYLDMIRSGELVDPLGYARAYYARYPAIAPAVYPPLFSVVEAAMFAVFGVSAWVARLTVALFLLAGGYGLMRLADEGFGPPAGLCAAGLYLVLPLVLYWGREVMLEPAATAVVTWSLVYARRFLVRGATRDLILCMGFATLAPYAKQNAIFVFPVLLAAVVGTGQWRRLLERRTILAIAAAALCGIPLAYVTFRYGSANLDQAFSQREAALPLLTHATYHLARLPSSVGWPVLGLCAVGLVAATRAWRAGAREDPHARCFVVVIAAWTVVGYLLLVPLLKEARHGLPWIPVFAVVGGVGLASLSSRLRSPLARVALASAVCAALLAGGASDRHLWCEGFAAPAAHLSRHWDGAAVLTSLEHDGAFVFRMRTLGDERVRVYRSSKIFESTMMHKRWGVDARLSSSEEVYDALRRFGIRHVVVDELARSVTPVEQILRAAVESDRFTRAATFPVVCPTFIDKRLEARPRQVSVYRYEGELAAEAEDPTIFLPVVGMEVGPEPAVGAR